MSKLLLANFLLLLGAVQVLSADNKDAKIICYYNSKSFAIEGKRLVLE